MKFEHADLAELRTDQDVGRVAGEVLAAVADAGRLEDAVYGARLGLPGEDVRPAAGIEGPVPYLSTLIVPGRRTGLGGKLGGRP